MYQYFELGKVEKGVDYVSEACVGAASYPRAFSKIRISIIIQYTLTDQLRFRRARKGAWEVLDGRVWGKLRSSPSTLARLPIL